MRNVQVVFVTGLVLPFPVADAIPGRPTESRAVGAELNGSHEDVMSAKLTVIKLSNFCDKFDRNHEKLSSKVPT